MPYGGEGECRCMWGWGGLKSIPMGGEGGGYYILNRRVWCGRVGAYE